MKPKKKVERPPEKRAVVLLSGGLDSATALYYALSEDYDTYCLSFHYGQRHKRELDCAKRLAGLTGSEWQLVGISLPWKGSSLLEKKISLPQSGKLKRGIPSTYVAARNIIFLSYAASYAEVVCCKKIFIGANQIDYSGYPDCRSSFLKAFEKAVNAGTKAGINGGGIEIAYPLIDKRKEDIIAMGRGLGVPFEHTWSCYKGGKTPCGRCDSCVIRQRGFDACGLKDPLTG